MGPAIKGVLKDRVYDAMLTNHGLRNGAGNKAQGPYARTRGLRKETDMHIHIYVIHMQSGKEGVVSQLLPI